MEIKKKNGLEFVSFKKFERYGSDICHGIFTRKNGFSKGLHKSLNVSFNIGDDSEHIKKNRLAVLDCMESEKLVFVKQVHGTEIIEYKTGTTAPPSDKMIEADALVSNVPGLLLLIKVADCQAVLLYDPIQKVVANIHSGWQGSVHNIIGKTVKVMKNSYDCDPKHIIAGVGPSLGPCCAEFINYKDEIPEKYWKFMDDKKYFDFWAISSDQLCSAGVLKENISIAGLCTKCNTDLFYSYRGEKVTGRFGGVIGLKKRG